MKPRRSKAQKMSSPIAWTRLGLLSCFTVLGLAVRPDFQTAGDFWLVSLLGAFSVDPVLHLLLFVGLCFFYFHALRYIQTVLWGKRDRVCTVIPAALFAAFMVFGRSFANAASWDLVFGNSLQLVKSLVAWNGYFILFSIAIAMAFAWLPSAKLWREKSEGETFRSGLWGRYQRCWSTHPFLTPFFTMLVMYLPYMVVSYPGIIMGDTPNMIIQGFNVADDTSNYLNLIDETVRLNGHHPIVYTMFLHACLVLGKSLFHSYNIGLFFAALLQLVAQFAAMAAVLAQLTRLRFRFRYTVGLALFFALAPRNQNYAFLLTKDVWACCALLLFLLSTFRLLSETEADAKNMVCGAVASIGICLLRNEGRYVVFISVVAMMLLAPQRGRKLVIPGLAGILSACFLFRVFMPAAHITQGSKREMLSVPFQQTARYFRDYPNDVTAEERAAIGAVLDVETIGERYVPEKSDAVKNTYHETATSADLAAYFKAWFQMGLKHPGVYLQATINNYYNYVYPGRALSDPYTYAWSSHCIGFLDSKAMREAGIQVDLSHPKSLDRPRQNYEALRERVFDLPLLSLAKSAATYVWGLTLLVFYNIKQRNRYGLALAVPLLLFVGVCFLGPCNGNYFRYLYGVSVALPAVFFLSMWLKSSKDEVAL